jgi:hypothetical protein
MLHNRLACIARENASRVRHKFLREPHASEWKACHLLGVPIAKRETLQTPSTKIEYIKISERCQCGIAGQPTANESRFLLARKKTDRMSRGCEHPLSKVVAVCRFANRARGD